jgi:hypothetical protein
VNSPSRPSSGRGTPQAAYDSDVLLIADEPRKSRGSGKAQSMASMPDERSEPLDMESVVRRLIALLREESLP